MKKWRLRTSSRGELTISCWVSPGDSKVLNHSQGIYKQFRIGGVSFRRVSGIIAILQQQWLFLEILQMIPNVFQFWVSSDSTQNLNLLKEGITINRGSVASKDILGNIPPPPQRFWWIIPLPRTYIHTFKYMIWSLYFHNQGWKSQTCRRLSSGAR